MQNINHHIKLPVLNVLLPGIKVRSTIISQMMEKKIVFVTKDFNNILLTLNKGLLFIFPLKMIVQIRN